MKFSKIKLQMVKERNFDYNSKTITSAQDIVKCINKYEQLEKATEEHTILICLNTKNQIIAYTELAIGGINYCNLDIKSIFKTILLSNSSKFVLVHKHPSGDTTPSKNDIEVTKQILNSSKILNIEFLDHLVIGDNEYQSIMKDLKE